MERVGLVLEELVFAVERKEKGKNPRIIFQGVEVEVKVVVGGEGKVGYEGLGLRKNLRQFMGEGGRVRVLGEEKSEEVIAAIKKNIELIGSIYEIDKEEGKLGINKDAVLNEVFLFELLERSGYYSGLACACPDDAGKLQVLTDVQNIIQELISKLVKIDNTTSDEDGQVIVDYHVQSVHQSLKDL